MHLCWPLRVAVTVGGRRLGPLWRVGGAVVRGGAVARSHALARSGVAVAKVRSSGSGAPGARRSAVAAVVARRGGTRSSAQRLAGARRGGGQVGSVRRRRAARRGSGRVRPGRRACRRTVRAVLRRRVVRGPSWSAAPGARQVGRGGGRSGCLSRGAPSAQSAAHRRRRPGRLSGSGTRAMLASARGRSSALPRHRSQLCPRG